MIARWLLLFCMGVLPTLLHAQDGSSQPPPDAIDKPDHHGELIPETPLVDGQFGISVEALALRRSVQMYQWIPPADATASWRAEWSDSLISIPDTLADDLHRNPDAKPFESVLWRAETVLLNGHPVDGSLFAHFQDWQPLAVTDSALPPNLAASLKSNDDCLFSGDDPQHPEVGDLRICWNLVAGGPISGSVQLRNGRWRADGEPVRRAERHSDFDWDDLPGGRMAVIAAAVLGFLLLMLALWRGRRQ